MGALSFSSIFLVPLCAGIAAFETERLATAQDLVSPRATRAVLRIGVAVWIATMGVVLLSFAAVGAQTCTRPGDCRHGPEICPRCRCSC